MNLSHIEESLQALYLMSTAHPDHFGAAEHAQIQWWYQFVFEESGHPDIAEREQIDQMFHNYSYLLV